MRTDLPLARDRVTALVPLLVGVMVFLAVLAAAGALALDNVLDSWRRDVSGSLTAQIPPVPGIGEATRAATDDRVARAVEQLRGRPGIADVRALDEAELTALVEPWIGSADLVGDLPLPRLIDIQLKPGALQDLDIPALTEALQEVAPGATLDEHRLWLSRLMDLGDAVGVLGLVVVLVVGGATTAAVIHATLAGLAMHRPVIETLHTIGAQDDYIARQFAFHALMQGIKGGAGGFLLALPALAGLGVLIDRIEGGLMPGMRLSVLDWGVLLTLPAGGAALAMVTARLTVLRTLARLP